MRIVHVCPRCYPYVGGVEVVVKNISEKMLDFGHKVKVYATDPSLAKPRSFIRNGVDFRVYPVFAPNEAYYLPSPHLLFDLSREEADILHSHGITALTTLAAYSVYQIRKNARFIVSPYYHGRGHTKFARILHVPYRPIITKTLKNANGVIVNSKTQRDLIEQTFGSSAKVFTIYDGVNLDRISVAKPVSRPDNLKIILYVGRLEKYKNIHTTIASLKKLPVNYHFYIIGSGPFKSNLEKCARSLRLASRVHFLGFQPDAIVYQWLKAAHVLVHLSSVESFGMTCIESLAAGVPVIANSDGLGLTETIQLYPKNILIYRVGKEPISKLSKLIIEVAEFKPIAEDVSRFSWERITNGVVAAYEDVLSYDR